MNKFLKPLIFAALLNVLEVCGDDQQQSDNPIEKPQVKTEETKTVTPQATNVTNFSKFSQTDFKQEDLDSPKSDNLLLVITIISLITTTVAISITFYLYRWRKLLQANPSSMVPEEWGGVLREHSSVVQQITDAINQSSKVTSHNTETFSSNIQQNSEKLEQMISTFVTLQKSLDEKDQELELIRRDRHDELSRRDPPRH